MASCYLNNHLSRSPRLVNCCRLLLTFVTCLAFPIKSDTQLLPIVGDRGGAATDALKTYIVHVKKPHSWDLSAHELKQWHQSFLPSPILDSGEPRLIYSYREAISGFAAKLTAAELASLKTKNGFMHAWPDKKRTTATTYTPQFLGLTRIEGSAERGVWDSGNMGQDVVIGVIDSGITPSHPSFSDVGMAPLTGTFTGSCTTESGVVCNNKIVGARGFHGGPGSAIDDNGHGTHVASIAAGNFVDGASVLGMAAGMASGMAPRAYLSIYKVVYEGEATDSDLLAALEQAIKDKVDIISLSLSAIEEEMLQPYYEDAKLRGSLQAFRKKIATVAAAGNGGPKYEDISIDAPWLLTVGGSSTDRKLRATVMQGDRRDLTSGESAYQPSSFESKMLPLTFPGMNGDKGPLYCLNGSLDSASVRGKIVVCSAGETDGVSKGKVVAAAGGAAMVIMNTEEGGYTTRAEAHVLPASHLSYRDGWWLEHYLETHGNSPMATITFMHTLFDDLRPYPAVASLSSRGPGKHNGGILKPDVLAPAVNVLGAWPSQVGPPPASGTPPATVNFDIKAGTSGAAPHVAGIMALIKQQHPTWSPSAIQSAIITSAMDHDRDGNYITDESTNMVADIVTTGAGQVNPAGALDPGLVYEIDPETAYPEYLCWLDYEDEMVEEMMPGCVVNCSALSQDFHAWSLNYPSIYLPLPISIKAGHKVKVKRTVKHVDESAEEYRAHITTSPEFNVELSPNVLSFTRSGEEKSFHVTITVESVGKTDKAKYLRGKIEWRSEKHVVKTPVGVQIG